MLALVLMLSTACGGEGSRVFGEAASPCPPTVLTNDTEDVLKAAAGSDCFVVNFNAGQPVVWDVLVPTVEGDPIPMRYEYDGDRVIITTDATRDSFGRGGVTEQVCDGVRTTEWLPEGIDCLTRSGEGFTTDSLPGDS